MTQTIYILIGKRDKRKYGYSSFTDGEFALSEFKWPFQYHTESE